MKVTQQSGVNLNNPFRLSLFLNVPPVNAVAKSLFVTKGDDIAVYGCPTTMCMPCLDVSDVKLLLLPHN